VKSVRYPKLPQREIQKANLSFKNIFPHISVLDEASDFKFGTQLGFAKAHHKITSREKSVGGLGLEEFPQILGFSYNISATAGASDFKFGTPLGFAKAHHKIPLEEKVGVAHG